MPFLGTGDFSRPSLEAPVWHSLLLGAIENNSHFVALLVGVHCPANEESPSLPLALSEDAASSLSRPLCPGNHVLITPLSRIRATCGAFLRTRMTIFFSVIVNLEHVQPYHFTICIQGRPEQRAWFYPRRVDQFLDVCSCLAPQRQLDLVPSKLTLSIEVTFRLLVFAALL